MFIIGLNLADNQIVHIKSCKGPTEAWKTICNIHEMKSLSKLLLICQKFVTYKMQEENDLLNLNHVNKFKMFEDQFACLKTKTLS